MINHVMIGSNDIERAKRFYDAVLGTIGVAPVQPHKAPSGHARILYKHDGHIFCVTEPINGEPATIANGSTIGFKCTSVDQVHAFHEAALRSGGTPAEAPPGIREGALGPMYLAYVRDPDGNKICAIHRVQQNS